jgi:death on curing protein
MRLTYVMRLWMIGGQSQGIELISGITNDLSEVALLHSVARNHALIDGNKRLALAAVIAFYGLNGHRLTLTNDEAYDLVMSVAAGQLDTVDVIAAVLRPATRPRT